VLYEPPDPGWATAAALAPLERLAARADWDGLVEAFMRELLRMPAGEVEAIRATPFWRVWTADAEATLQDLRALARHRFDAARCRALALPVQLLIGTESAREVYLTDALVAVLPDVRVTALTGQAHEGMTTAPDQFVDAIAAFLLE
jgi:pimeloyl-ACP methyl ester carboxylesterase